MAGKIILCLLVGYLFGNFSTAYVIGKLHHVDIRNYGSGNAGTTNAIRTLGKKSGYLVFVGDFLKVLIPALFVRFVVFRGEEVAPLMCQITGLGVVLGHCYPFWLHFKGGKGIATTSGAMLCSDWTCVFFLPVFAIIVAVSKYVSLGSMFVVFLFPVWTAVRYPENAYYVPMICVCCLYTVSGVFMHRANLRRLLNGTENKIGHHVQITDEKK